jgi:hypothetical protein
MPEETGTTAAMSAGGAWLIDESAAMRIGHCGDADNAEHVVHLLSSWFCSLPCSVLPCNVVKLLSNRLQLLLHCCCCCIAAAAASAESPTALLGWLQLQECIQLLLLLLRMVVLRYHKRHNDILTPSACNQTHLG